MAGWQPKAPKWAWRDFLTDEERNTLARADAAKLTWEALNIERGQITNRAIHRAKYAARLAQEGKSNPDGVGNDNAGREDGQP